MIGVLDKIKFLELPDGNYALVIDKDDIPTGSVILNPETPVSVTPPSIGQSNLLAEVIAQFSDRPKKVKWAKDLMSKPEAYLTSKDQEFIASNIKWDWRRMCEALPAGSLSDSEKDVFQVKPERLKNLLELVKKQVKTVQNMTESAPVDTFSAEDIPF